MADLKNERISFVSEVHQQLTDLIRTGAWKEGDKLPTEHQLAARFHVSRVVIREALQKLRTEQLIVTKHGTGSFVSNPENFLSLSHTDDTSAGTNLTEQEFRDLMDIRAYIEFRAIKLAAARATEEDLRSLCRAMEQMRDTVDDLDAFTLADYNFHYTIVQASHHRMLCRIYDLCREQICYRLREMDKPTNRRGWALELHQKLCDLVVSRDGKGAVKCLREHNEYNYALLKDFFVPENNP